MERGNTRETSLLFTAPAVQTKPIRSSHTIPLSPSIHPSIDEWETLASLINLEVRKKKTRPSRAKPSKITNHTTCLCNPPSEGQTQPAFTYIRQPSTTLPPLPSPSTLDKPVEQKSTWNIFGLTTDTKITPRATVENKVKNKYF